MRYVIPVSKVRCAICGVLYDSKHSDGIRAAGRLFAKLPLPPKTGGFVRVNGKAFIVGSLTKTGGTHPTGFHFHKVDVVLYPLFGDSKARMHQILNFFAPNLDGKIVVTLVQTADDPPFGYRTKVDVKSLVIKPRLSRAEKSLIPLVLLKGIPKPSSNSTTVGDLLDALEYPSKLRELFTRKLEKGDLSKIKHTLKKLGVI